jgi:nucleotide-binding universal stress UspA family protein
MARSYRALLDFLPSEVEVGGHRVRVDRIVKVARDVATAVAEAAHDEDIDLVLLHWKGYARQPKRYLYGRTIDTILKRPPCDVALVRPEGWRESKRILLPVRGGPAAEKALPLALALAEHLGVRVSVMHNVHFGPQAAGAPAAESLVEARGEEPYIVFNEHLKSTEETSSVPVERILTVGGDPAAALIAELRPSDFVVMGMAALEPGEKDGQGSGPEPPLPITLRVSEAKGPPLMLLRTVESIDLAGYKQRVRAGRSRKGWHDMPFEHWFVENTFHGDEFKDPEAFLEAKRRTGLTISVALLTSNDSENVRSALVGVKRVLAEMHPIADQIAVIDADSTDDTREVARSLGVEVYRCSELLPSRGSLHGRGECWWKSLSALWGDIIVWLDPRAQRFHPSTAMSLAGPLLRIPTLQLAKAYGQPQGQRQGGVALKAPHIYGAPHTAHPHPQLHGRVQAPARSHHASGTSDYAPVDMSWGGFVIPEQGTDWAQEHGRIRVQALRPSDLRALDTATIAALPPRTILQVFSPALASVVEPFSHDMAGRRDAMLSLPAFIGDNLEVGLLLSVAAEYGTKAIAQVELRHAMPAPPPPPGLRVAIDLLQALSKRLNDTSLRRLAAETAERLQKSVEGNSPRGYDASAFEVRALGPVERPPMLPILTEGERSA